MSDEQSLADVKARLAQLGQTVQPDAIISHRPRPTGERTNIVILDRVRPNELPEYCVHGYAGCVRCGELCWLGHETSRIVGEGEAAGLCLHCANELHAEGHLPKEQRIGNANDHRRADGPHE